MYKKEVGERETMGRLLPGSGDCRRIGIVGLTAGAGVGLVTMCLAGYLAETRKERLTVVELGTGGLYDRLGMNRRFLLRDYYSFYKAAVGELSLRRLENKADGINWALKKPEEREERLEYKAALRLIYGVGSDIALFDFSGRGDEEGWLLLKEMDVVLALIDPSPAKLVEGYKRLERWKLSKLPIRYMINKDNRGVGRKELERFLKLKPADRIPFLEPALLYEAEYSGINPYTMDGVKNELKPVFDRLLDGKYGLT